MRVCIPIAETKGLESSVYGHFGSAPHFAIVDTETLAIELQENLNLHHGHGMCNPLRATGGRKFDAILVSGIGQRALIALGAAGVAVFRCEEGTVRTAVESLAAGRSLRFSPDDSCPGHAEGHVCAH